MLNRQETKGEVTMFSANLKKKMKEKKITSRALASQIGVTETYISYLITGKKRPSMRIVETLAEFFGVDSADLITKKEPLPNEELGALAEKYKSVLLAMESMRPDLVAELTSRIEAAASLFPRKDASEKQSQGGASYSRTKKPG